MNNAKFVHEFLSELGGTAAVAKVCGITNSAVSQWRNKGKIPKAQENAAWKLGGKYM